MPSLWRDLSAQHRRWLVQNALVVTAFINAGVNALIAWLSVVSEDEVPLWAVPIVDRPSTITDTVGTFFFLPLITTLLITTVVWHELSSGRLERLALDHIPASLLRRLPRTRLRRGLVLGLLCMILLGPPAAAVLVALDFGDLSVGEFVLYKAIFGVALGALVTPLIALVAMGDDRAAAVASTGIEP